VASNETIVKIVTRSTSPVKLLEKATEKEFRYDGN